MISLTLERSKKILGISVPIIAGMLSQNILNLIDTAMIGYLGDFALAATGISGFLFFFSTATLFGISDAAQVFIARHFGANNDSTITKPFNTSLVIVVLLGSLISILFYKLSPFLFSKLSPDVAVATLAFSYFKWLSFGLIPFCISICYRAYFNGTNRTLPYLIIVLIMHVTNVLFNYLLIFGKFCFPQLGLEGAGIATFISYIVGAVLFLGSGFKLIAYPRYLSQLCSMAELKDLLKTAVPTATRQLFFFLGLLYFFWVIGFLGAQSVAIAHVLVNLILIVILPGIGFGLTAMSLVSQALGRDNNTEAESWAWDIVQLAAIVTIFIGLVGLVFPKQVLSVFIHSPETLNQALAPFRLDCLTIWIEVVGLVLLNALIGSGKAATVMKVSFVCQWLVFAPLAYLLAAVLGLGLVWIFASWVFYQFVATCTYIWLWKYRFK